jgi:hypothetical protein
VVDVVVTSLRVGTNLSTSSDAGPFIEVIFRWHIQDVCAFASHFLIPSVFLCSCENNEAHRVVYCVYTICDHFQHGIYILYLHDISKTPQRLKRIFRWNNDSQFDAQLNVLSAPKTRSAADGKHQRAAGAIGPDQSCSLMRTQLTHDEEYLGIQLLVTLSQ